MILLWLILILLLGGLFAWAVARWSALASRWISLVAVSADFVIGLVVWLRNAGRVDLLHHQAWLREVDRSWIPSFGIHFHLALDGLSLLLLMLTFLLGIMSVVQRQPLRRRLLPAGNGGWYGRQNQVIPGHAIDLAGNTGSAGITLSIDKTPPSFVALSTPDHISRLHGGQVSATVNDNFTVTQVALSVNGVPLGTFTNAPYQANLAVPVGVSPGDTLTVTAQATDQAGNTQTATRSVRVAADGVIVGQVLDDVTSFPLQNSNVQVISATGSVDQTDDRGRYSLQATDSHLFLSMSGSATGNPTTTVEREVFVQDGVGTVPVDARLTTLATPVAIGSAGGNLKSGAVSISIPAGTVLDGTTFRLTPLSGQGLLR